jgi:hypothetical protein
MSTFTINEDCDKALAKLRIKRELTRQEREDIADALERCLAAFNNAF